MMSECTKSSENSQRVIFLVDNVSIEILRDVFYSKVPKSDVVTFFATPEVKDELRGAFLTKEQRMKVFTDPDPDTFDVPLLIFLLTNEKICGLPKFAGAVSVDSCPSNTSLEADIFDLENIRNKVAHHSDRYLTYEYESLLNQLEDVLVRIAWRVSASEAVKVKEMIKYVDAMEFEPFHEREESLKNLDDDRFEVDCETVSVDCETVSEELYDAQSDKTDKEMISLHSEMEQAIDEIESKKEKTLEETETRRKQTFDVIKHNSENSTSHELANDSVSCLSLEKEEEAIKTAASRDELDDLCREKGRRNNLVIKHCNSICSMIKNFSEFIIHVYAAYRKKSESEIVFVITVLWDFDLTENDIPYRFVKRNYGYFSTEGFDISNGKEERDYVISADENRKLNACLSKYCVELMGNHKFLSIISGSSVRSKAYKPSSPCIIREICLALYVYVKGYIPIEEDAFKSTYGGVPVDIREGLFFPNGTATEYHDNIKMGCMITRPTHSSRVLGGTLGGFIEHPTYGLCGITCAHAMMYPDELKDCRNGEISWPNIRLSDSVCQPKHPDRIGRIVQAIYNEGGESETGVEVALIQIEDRPPVSGEFPKFEQNGTKIPLNTSFETGRTCGITKFIGKKLCKFGCKTNFTYSNIITSTPVSVKEIRHIWDYDGFEIKLYNQIQVKNQGANFATNGDSGSLVFCEGLSGDLECIGMVEGSSTNDTCVVTPIQPILQALKVSHLKEFESVKSKKLVSAIDDRLHSVEKTINGMSSMMKMLVDDMNSRKQSQTLSSNINAENNVKSSVDMLVPNQTSSSTICPDEQNAQKSADVLVHNQPSSSKIDQAENNAQKSADVLVHTQTSGSNINPAEHNAQSSEDILEHDQREYAQQGTAPFSEFKHRYPLRHLKELKVPKQTTNRTNEAESNSELAPPRKRQRHTPEERMATDKGKRRGKLREIKTGKQPD